MKYIVSAQWEFDDIVNAGQQIKNLFEYDPDQHPESVSIYTVQEDKED